jgi:hypothetical protein
MKYVVDMGQCALIYTPSFTKTGSCIQKVMGGGGVTGIQTAWRSMIIIFWEMTPCGSYKNRRFGGSYRLHVQGARVRAGYRAKLLALV